MLTFEYRGLGEAHQLSDYQETWDYQREVHAAVADGLRDDHTIYVEHSPVYTAGRRTDPADHPVDGTPVIPVDRGGEITYHGPGQLVGYPILALADGVGVVDYVRALEGAVISLLAGYGIVSGRVVATSRSSSCSRLSCCAWRAARSASYSASWRRSGWAR